MGMKDSSHMYKYSSRCLERLC